MYIVLESYSDQDPRVVPEIEYIDSLKWAIFEVAYIKTANLSKVDFSKLNYSELDNDQYKAFKFLSAGDDYTLSVAAGSDIHGELKAIASLEAHPYKPKFKYTLTEDDKVKLVDVYKIVMRLYVTYHYNSLGEETIRFNEDNRAKILAEIETLTNTEQCRVLMHTKFGTSCSSKLAERNNLGASQILLSDPMPK
jgi:hypothetical protein